MQQQQEEELQKVPTRLQWLVWPAGGLRAAAQALLPRLLLLAGAMQQLRQQQALWAAQASHLVAHAGMAAQLKLL
jgi:hypothetical protein